MNSVSKLWLPRILLFLTMEFSSKPIKEAENINVFSLTLPSSGLGLAVGAEGRGAYVPHRENFLNLRFLSLLRAEDSPLSGCCQHVYDIAYQTILSDLPYN